MTTTTRRKARDNGRPGLLARSKAKPKAPSPSTDVVLIDHAHQDIIRVLEITEETKREIACKPLEDAIRDANTFAAFRDCLRRAGASLPMVNKAAEIHIRNRRQAGLILLGMLGKSTGGRPSKTGDTMSPVNGVPTYGELGIEKKFAQRVQDEARVDEADLEEFIRKVEADGTKQLTVKDIERMGRRKRFDAQKAGWEQNHPLSGTVTLARCDALEYLSGIEPGSVDLLLTDPPYCTDVEDIDAFARSWLTLALSRIKRTGRAYVFIGSYPAEVGAYWDAYHRPAEGAAPHCLKLDMILPWIYRNTIGPATKETYKLNWQACLYFLGPEAPALNCGNLTEKFSVQDFNAPDSRFGVRVHPWQKPDDLAIRLISQATMPGQTVLDPFAGTGTFLAAAARLGRNAIGCEIDEEMLAFCRQRGLLP
jgi:16S rRNA G966 N2-methylase RsmD